MPECHLCGVEDHLSDLEVCQWCECLTCEDCGRDCEQEDGDPVGFFCDDCTALETLAAEVERLRAELAQLRKDWCDDDEAIKQQALRVLDAAKVEGDSVYVPRMGALAEMMADELVKVCAELAAAKAASVVPVEAIDCYFDEFPNLGVVRVLCKSGEDAKKVVNWLRDRMKERNEG